MAIPYKIEMVIDGELYETLSAAQFSANFDI